MRRRRGQVGGTMVAVVIMVGIAVAAEAQTCGDANRTGSVTVTDGVLILRAAAQLPGTCPKERCDMNLDNTISVTDGVLALRVAAGLGTEVACSASSAESIFGEIIKSTGVGRTASPSGRARAAGTTEPCSGGGFTEDDGTVLTFVECQDGDFVTDGTLTFEEDGNDVFVSFATTDLDVTTGEVVTTTGDLTYTFADDTRVNGTLDYDSSVLGSYTDEFDNVLLNSDTFDVVAGNVFTTVTAGDGLFANVDSIKTNIYSPTLARITINYENGGSDIFTLGDGLCEPCSSGCSNASLQCVTCADECDGETSRCGVDFDVTECDDGVFGPIGLCDPCNSNADCNASEGLGCFDCDSECTGSTKRCGSSLAFIECEDGLY